MHHITHDFTNLNLSSKQYDGGEHIRAGDCSGLSIQSIGGSSLSSPHSSFLLCNLHHVPSITKNLISVSKFYGDNSCYFEFHAPHFSVKDTLTRKFLITGPIHDGLYVFPSSLASSFSPSAHLGEKTSIA